MRRMTLVGWVVGLQICAGAASSRANAAETASPEVRALIAQLSTNDPAARANAAVALGSMGARASAAVPALLNLVDDNRAVGELIASGFAVRTYVGVLACEALGRIGDKRAVMPLCNFMRQRQGVGGRDDRWLNRQAATKALGQLGDPSAVEFLLQEAADTGTLASSREAGDSIVQIGPGAVPVLAKAASSGTRAKKLQAAEFLGRLGEPAVKPLIDLLKKADAKDAVLFASALAKTGHPDAAQALCDILNSKKTSQRTIIIEALEPLARWIEAEKSDRKRLDADIILILQGQAVEPLIGVLANKAEKERLREVAARVLGRTNDPRSAGPLVEALKDKSDKVRWSAFYALVNLAFYASREKEPLGEVDAANKDRWAKNQAELLVALKDKAVGPLIECMRDQKMASDANRALRNLAGR